MSDEVIFEQHDKIALIKINRPQARNAINGGAARAIAEAIDHIDSTDSIAVGIITGESNTFCSGMDLKGFLTGDLPSIKGRGFAGLVESPPRKPLIAAVEGYALAGGCEIALACDLIVAAIDAKFGLPEVKRGLVPTGGGALRLQKQLPFHIAMELLLTGGWLSADRAYQFGFVNRLTPSGDALEIAFELARAIASNGPLAVEATKRIAMDSRDWNDAEGFSKQRAISDPVFQSSDAKEGARAFAEKRQAVWTRS